MNKTIRKAIVVFLVLLVFAIVVYGAIIWTKITTVTIEEPFTVESNLPDSLSLYPGKEAHYYIKVTNKGRTTYNAILYYETTADQGVKFTINPESGTSQTVMPGETVNFDISIIIDKDSGTGKLTINWRIERS